MLCIVIDFIICALCRDADDKPLDPLQALRDAAKRDDMVDDGEGKLDGEGEGVKGEGEGNFDPNEYSDDDRPEDQQYDEDNDGDDDGDDESSMMTMKMCMPRYAEKRKSKA
jgi:hypothetical protein